jgi:hypothetical protein
MSPGTIVKPVQKGSTNKNTRRLDTKLLKMSYKSFHLKTIVLRDKNQNTSYSI